MIIRKAKTTDLLELMRIFEMARNFMRDNGNPSQWGENYPEKELLLSDIAKGHSYVCINDVTMEVVGTFCFFVGIEPVYFKIKEGTWLNDEPYGVVHRIATVNKSSGVGTYCLNWCLEQCNNVRIDTHRDNISMQKTLEKNKYIYCGVIQWEDGTDRIAFQKTK